MIRQNQKIFNALLIPMDLIILLVSFLITWYIRFNSGLIPVREVYLSFNEYLVPAIIIAPIFILINAIFGTYVTKRYKTFYVEAIKIIQSNFVAWIIFIFLLFTFKIIDYSRYLLVTYYVVSTFALIFSRGVIRLVQRSYRSKGYNKWHVLVVGHSDICARFIRRVNRNRHWGYNIVGIIDDNYKIDAENHQEVALTQEIPILGKIADLEDILENTYVDEIYITLNLEEYKKVGKIIAIAEKHGVRIEIIPDFTKYISSKPAIDEFDGIPVINVRQIPLDEGINNVIKRTVDIIGSLILILITLPVMIFVYITIKITSPGPAIFKQERVGLNKQNFTMYKFRSMKIQKEEEEKAEWTTENDPRKTRFGSFIRKTSIDELPQFFNVLKGDMSLIGPRPERPFFVEKFKEEIPKYMVKHQIRPGITGWAQVSGWRGDTSIEKRIEYDIYYIENWSLAFDIKILFLTVFKGFVNKNAY
ncbi:undecaprenyl-phosphate glucose phosphotransferase [Clostridium cellulovorans]|uniref:Undecaprenyl-phosphate glucose phosphotransferase n=1 Tax=Clostridium cellulovorans (strain ATCC 35296 / DSM 3052 / OCM 3 / 743B) TaxID=573061 RepID=D9SWQ8_CLOC7|nr:undecaprenyl-phosphate glucose phosphotransferase [Clostridium cellulovorans]ADL53340.1 Undecaprenyl-phosphate glucose phosphotransferase [Clostridium cellulovorans 743B]